MFRSVAVAATIVVGLALPVSARSICIDDAALTTTRTDAAQRRLVDKRNQVASCPIRCVLPIEVIRVPELACAVEPVPDTRFTFIGVSF